MNFYMLDTNIVSLSVLGKGNVNQEIREKNPSSICVSSITVAELMFGIEYRKKGSKIQKAVEELIEEVQVLDFDESAARVFGVIASDLKRTGCGIGPMDTMLAAHAVSMNAIFVTNNTRHFERVEGLSIEDWSI